MGLIRKGYIRKIVPMVWINNTNFRKWAKGHRTDIRFAWSIPWPGRWHHSLPQAEALLEGTPSNRFSSISFRLALN